MLADYTNDRKEWKIKIKKIEEHKRQVFALVYAQLSDSSRNEVEDHADWAANFLLRDLLYLITRIRATHIARQSGNPAQDMERVRNGWNNLRMMVNESSFAFRKRVDDYQFERSSVGLPLIPDGELIIGILNRLDMTRYASLVKDYLDNERRGIAELPILPSSLWKEIKDTQIKDTQVTRFRGITGGMTGSNLHSVFLATADEMPKYRKHDGHGARVDRGGRGHGRGNNRPMRPLNPVPPPGPPPRMDSIRPRNIICYSCGKKGHKSDVRPMKATGNTASMATINYTESTQDAQIFSSAVATFSPTDQDIYPQPVLDCETVSVLSSNTNNLSGSILMLDTQRVFI